LAAAPSIGRASAVEPPPTASEADLTRDLYERYAGQIYGYCLHKLGSREEAEDAVQNTFLNAFRGLRRGVVPQAESAWLFKIAENVCLSRHRSSFRRGRVETPSDLQAIQDFTPSPERRSDDLIGLEEALARMPEAQRRAILLREWQGLSYREISVEMELSQAAVETLIFRARRTLAQGLEDEPKSRRWKKMRQAADTGSIIALLKTLFTTGATVKAVATAVAVGTAVVAASTGALAHHQRASHAKPVAHAPAAVSSTSSTQPVGLAPSASKPAAATKAARGAKSATPAALVLPAGTVSSILTVPGDAAAPTTAPSAAATPAATPTPTPAPTPQADAPRPVDMPTAPPPVAAAPTAPVAPVTQAGPAVGTGTITPDPAPAPVTVTSPPKPTVPTTPPKPAVTIVQIVTSTTGPPEGNPTGNN